MYNIFDAIVNGIGTQWDFKEMENFNSLSFPASLDKDHKIFLLLKLWKKEIYLNIPNC